MTTTINPERILRELSELWVSLGKESEADQGSGVLRACAMTLIATVEESEDPSDIWATIAALMPEHPSRAIVIRLHPSTARELSSRVFSQCWMPFGHRRQICCEQIEIIASDASIPDLPPVILPLAVSDLPMIVWCRGPRLFALPDFPQLAGMAHKLILDSAAYPDPRSALLQFAERAGKGGVLADLAWTRLTRFRELVSQIFQNRSYLARLPKRAQIRIGFGGDSPPTAAYYLAAWLLDRLQGAAVTWQPMPGFVSGELAQVELSGADDAELRLSIRATGDREPPTAELRVDSLTSRVVFPPDNDYTLLREELLIPGRDAVYDASLARAARLIAEGR